MYNHLYDCCYDVWLALLFAAACISSVMGAFNSLPLVVQSASIYCKPPLQHLIRVCLESVFFIPVNMFVRYTAKCELAVATLLCKGAALLYCTDFLTQKLNYPGRPQKILSSNFVSYTFFSYRICMFFVLLKGQDWPF